MIIFVVGTLVLLAMISWATYRTAQVLADFPPAVNLLLLPSENLVRIVLIGLCIGLARVSGLPPMQFGWAPARPALDIATGCMVGLLVALPLPHLTRIAVERFGKQIYSPLVILAVMPRTRRQWVWVPLALVSAVLLEELLFRALLIGGFGAFAPSVLLVLVWSMLFGAMHLPQGTLGMVAATALGLVLSALFLVTQNWLAPFAAHYVINILQIIWASHDKSWLDTFSGASSHP